MLSFAGVWVCFAVVVVVWFCMVALATVVVGFGVLVVCDLDVLFCLFMVVYDFCFWVW